MATVLAGTSVTRKAIRLASGEAAARLKRAGFNRQGVHLSKPAGQLFHAIHFQASQWGSQGEGRFTVNFIVASPVLYETWYGKPFPRNPASAPFPIQMRIGQLMPGHRDHWWDVHDGDDLDGLAVEVADAVQSAAQDFFLAYETSEGLLQRLRQGNCPGCTAPQAAVLHMLLASSFGHKDEAEAAGRQALESSQVASFSERVIALARLRGLELS